MMATIKRLCEICERHGMPADQEHVLLWLDRYLDSTVAFPLGADGVPIAPHDVVYGGDGRAWRVEHVRTGGGKAELYPVVAVDRGGRRNDLKAEWLTHERPDSWERLEEDANKTPDRYLRDNGIETDGSVPNGYLIQRLDLVRRAKALAGVQKVHTCGEEGR